VCSTPSCLRWGLFVGVGWVTHWVLANRNSDWCLGVNYTQVITDVLTIDDDEVSLVVDTRHDDFFTCGKGGADKKLLTYAIRWDARV
jgi:hypothetical protein